MLHTNTHTKSNDMDWDVLFYTTHTNVIKMFFVFFFIKWMQQEEKFGFQTKKFRFNAAEYSARIVSSVVLNLGLNVGICYNKKTWFPEKNKFKRKKWVKVILNTSGKNHSRAKETHTHTQDKKQQPNTNTFTIFNNGTYVIIKTKTKGLKECIEFFFRLLNALLKIVA